MILVGSFANNKDEWRNCAVLVQPKLAIEKLDNPEQRQQNMLSILSILNIFC